MSDNYWAEVERQPKELSQQGVQELNYLLSVLHGKRQSSERFHTRVKWIGLAIGIIVSLSQAWDWIVGVFKSWHPSH